MPQGQKSAIQEPKGRKCTASINCGLPVHSKREVGTVHSYRNFKFIFHVSCLKLFSPVCSVKLLFGIIYPGWFCKVLYTFSVHVYFLYTTFKLYTAGSGTEHFCSALCTVLGDESVKDLQILKDVLNRTIKVCIVR